LTQEEKKEKVSFFPKERIKLINIKGRRREESRCLLAWHFCVGGTEFRVRGQRVEFHHREISSPTPPKLLL
jgi:hypothetical protein